MALEKTAILALLSSEHKHAPSSFLLICDLVGSWRDSTSLTKPMSDPKYGARISSMKSALRTLRTSRNRTVSAVSSVALSWRSKVAIGARDRCEFNSNIWATHRNHTQHHVVIVEEKNELVLPVREFARHPDEKVLHFSLKQKFFLSTNLRQARREISKIPKYSLGQDDGQETIQCFKFQIDETAVVPHRDKARTVLHHATFKN